MILTVDLPKKLHEQIEKDMRATGLTKSYIVRLLIKRYYEKADRQLPITSAA
jgi:hypothetical protein